MLNIQGRVRVRVGTRLHRVHIPDERDRQVLRRIVPRVECRDLAAAHGVQVVLVADHRPPVVVVEHLRSEVLLRMSEERLIYTIIFIYTEQ